MAVREPSQRAQFPHLTQRGFDSIAPAQAYWTSKAQMMAAGVRDAGAYRGRLTAVAVLLAIIAALFAIPVFSSVP